MAKLLLFHFFLLFAFVQALDVCFYSQTCPSMNSIVQNITTSYVSATPSLAPALLRMQFHDCFVRGCDASILIDTTDQNKRTEKLSDSNKSVRGFTLINKIKSALEHVCPGVVSCADIVSLATRDAISELGGPYWKVELGRRDGRISIESDALSLPSPSTANVTKLKNDFLSKGLSVKDLVVLSGAHTIGISHCRFIKNRLYNFSSETSGDPLLDSKYLGTLRKKCPPQDDDTLVELDPGSHLVFENNYYQNLLRNRGLFQSDSALLQDEETLQHVTRLAYCDAQSFFHEFAESMEKMISIGVLTGEDGEIRTKCNLFN